MAKTLQLQQPARLMQRNMYSPLAHWPESCFCQTLMPLQVQSLSLEIASFLIFKWLSYALMVLSDSQTLMLCPHVNRHGTLHKYSFPCFSYWIFHMYFFFHPAVSVCLDTWFWTRSFKSLTDLVWLSRKVILDKIVGSLWRYRKKKRKKMWAVGLLKD